MRRDLRSKSARIPDRGADRRFRRRAIRKPLESVERSGRASVTPASSAAIPLPAWLTEADLDFYTRQFEKTGFRGAFNWYRNIDFNWLHTGFLIDAKISQPTLFVAGEHDGVLKFAGGAVERLQQNVPRLTKKVILPGKGHWIQQEAPEEVNRLILEFLANR